MTRLLSQVTILTLISCSCLASARAPVDTHVSQISDGEISGNTYHNRDLRILYQFPDGWNVSHKATDPEHEFGWKDNPSGKSAASQCSKNLFFTSKYREGMQLNGFNAMAVVIAVDPACLPKVKFPSEANDREGIRQVVEQVLDHLKTPALVGKTASQVHPFEDAGRLIVEFSQSFSLAMRESGSRGVRNVLSSVAVVRADEYWLIWIFAAASEADLGTLKSTKISFDSEAPRLGNAK